MKKSLRFTAKFLLYSFCALLMLAALALAGARVAVFYVHDYKEQIAALAGSYLGSPVQINDIELVWNRFDAKASLTGVRVKSPDGKRTRLVLPKLDLQLNARDMLLQRKLTVRNVSLHGLSLVAAYEGSGRISVQGYQRLSLARSSGGESGGNNAKRGASALEWLFNAESIAILDSEILLRDEARDRDYKLDKLNIRAFNDGNQHKIRISSALPNDLGDVSVAAFDFTGNAKNIKGWAGRFYLNGLGLDLEELARFAGMRDFDIAGLGDAQLWGEWKGTRLMQARAILAAEPLLVADENAELAARLALDVDWNRNSNGWHARFNEFVAHFDDGQYDLSGLDVALEKRTRQVRDIRVAGPAFDPLASPSLRAFLQARQPESAGWLDSVSAVRLSDWLLGLSTQRGGKTSLRTLVAEVSGLTTQAHGRIPGVEDLRGDVYLRDGVGRLTIPRQQIVVDGGRLTEHELPPVSLAGTLRFALGDGRWDLSGQDLQIETVDFASRSSLTLAGRKNGSLPMVLQTRLLGGDLAQADKYLPRPFIKPGLYRWLNSAIISGNLVHSQFDLQGDLRNFAPIRGKGTASAQFEFTDARVKYRDGWPDLENASGSLYVDASGLNGSLNSATIRDASVRGGSLTLDNYLKPVLEVQAQADGPVPDMLDFMQTGPLRDSVGQHFGDAVGTGSGRLNLDLEIPLQGAIGDGLVVNGDVSVDNASVHAREYGLNLQNVTGRIGFTRDGVDTKNLAARYLGLPMQINAVRRKPGGVKTNSVFVSGQMSVASILSSYDIELPPAFTGISPWQVQLDVRQPDNAPVDVSLKATSDLQGTAILLPAPLTKSVDTPLETTVEVNFSAPDRDWWVRVPDLVEGRIRVVDEKVESMAFAMGGSNNTVLPWTGIAVNGNVEVIDAQSWVEFALEISESEDDTPGEEVFPLFANLHAKQARVGSQLFGEMHYTAFRDGTHQVHRVDNDFVAGELLLRKTTQESEPLLLQLDFLDRELLAALGEEEDEDNVTDQPLDPRELPPFNISVKKLKWDNWQFSRVSLRTRPEDYGMAITGLTVRQDAMRISGSGRWSVRERGDKLEHSTSLDVNSTFLDVGRAVAEIGGGQTLASGVGEVALSLRWPTEAYSPDLAEMTGQLFFNLRNGRILTVDPGAGRILGLFALQALPRRLILDFRDLYESGLEYGAVNGNFSIANGVASTESLRLSGPVAEILVRGKTDFVEQRYDQNIEVLPRVSGALPLLGILSGGAAVGVTALVADEILKGVGLNLDEVGRRQYILGGSWDEPSWNLVPPARSATVTRAQ